MHTCTYAHAHMHTTHTLTFYHVGVVAQLIGWRAIFWVASAGGVVVFIAVFFLLPESLNPNGRKRSLNPLRPLLLLLHPAIFVAAGHSGLVFGSMYLIVFNFPLILANDFHFTELQSGLAFLPFGVCALIGTMLGGRSADWGYGKVGSPGRLIGSILGSFLMCGFFIMFGFSANTSPVGLMAATGGIGFCMTFARPGISTFAIDRQPTEPGSVAATVLSLAFGASFVMLTVSPPIIDAVGIEATFVALAVLMALWTIPVMAVMFYYWRFPSEVT
eukprot:TRINITY_DN5232_c0_g1_i1.p1 TRINITY_DN5232_c0_g1~~TRINITY_DN5232_c0_g1_i1.p1  ORF type:complete len:274 (-),score=16.36 TRINITY_DN5232_c0_g1_i1:60-881(-)